MILSEALKHYKNNFLTSIAFALLLVFVLLFAQFTNCFVSSGSIFLDYSLIKSNVVDFLLLIFSILVFLFFYSIFIALIIFAVRKDLSKLKIHYYLTEKIQKFALKLFIFFFIFFLILFLISASLINFGVPILAINAIFFLVSIAFLFLPQAIVIDEDSLPSSVSSNFEFILKHFNSFLLVLVTGAVLLAILPLVEFLFDYLFFVGRFVSLLISLIFIVPYLEVLKTILYMHKFELVKEAHKEIKPKVVAREISSIKEIK